jgi:hypothetical protein
MKLKPWTIVYQAISIYRSNFRQFFTLSLYATTWFIIANLTWFIFAAAIIVVSLFGLIALTYVPQFLSEFNNVSILFGSVASVVVLLALSIYSSAQGLRQEAIIGNIAYQYIIGQPISIETAFKHNRQYLWRFWLAQFLINIPVYAIESFSSSKGILIVILGTLLSTWIAGESLLAPLFISVNGCNAREALRMSKQRSRPYMLQIFLILLSTSVLAIPLGLLGFSPAIFVWFSEWQDRADSMPNFESISHLIQSLGLSIILITMLGSILIPLLQSIEAVIYTQIIPAPTRRSPNNI